VAKVHSIYAARARNRSVMDCEHNGVALAQRNHRHLGLHAGPLFCQNKFPGREIVRFR
jgi:hypothetical protein